MNREILFKGFHPCENGKDRVFINGEWINGKWIEGFISGLHVYGTDDKTGDITHIYSYYMNSVHPVIASTVGQYTGLTDKNNKKIFEGDIVKTKKYGKIIGHSNVADFDIFQVVYKLAVFRLENHNRGFNLVGNGSDFEVIGNIHDNPELLEAAE